MGQNKMAAVVVASFSEDKSLFSTLSVDGRLRIHNTSSGRLFQEYGDTSFTCFCWVGPERVKSTKRKKNGEKKGSLQNIALGTENGRVIIYNLASGQPQSTYSNHDVTKKINSLCFGPKSHLLYSGLSGGKICSWTDGTMKSSWIASKTSVNTLELLKTEETILSAGKMIKLWH